ncbi:plasmid mobilization relaxosome protein MobC [Brevundimonas nasdae]|uniref:Plasmid mobilization relaxosome protein MobC n=1 Tax=Brevundimonas nasdae TaxID=172043 RepID=A0ABX8TLF1_9CAUL|nr:plasmid mobilization relaxosome protein MobC [Brevundimonas nasdae]QYC11469.1 plasmid mobilization relaxosome protein MobC [Brevundimonas nasdae]QYC14257.1 plasmid mobilization relaxosome protein MobC [Brevundimonas nasdae]
MNRITVRLPSDLIRRFDRVAVGQGGRSRLLRRLMDRAAQAPFPAPLDAPLTGLTQGASLKLTLRLSPLDGARLAEESAAVGLSRTQWSVGLIRRRLHGRPQLVPLEQTSFIECRRELRRIGVNINQIVRALNTAVLEGQVLALEIAQLAAFQAEIGAWITALGQGFEGNLDYWSER